MSTDDTPGTPDTPDGTPDRGSSDGCGPVDGGPVDFGDDEAVHGDHRWRAAALRQLPYYVQVFRGPDHVNVGETDEVVALYGDQRNVGRQIADYLTGAEGQGLIEMLDRVYAGERLTARGVRFGVVTAAGSAQEVFADMDFLPLRDASGHVVGSIASGHDVTDQVRADHEQAAEAVELSRRYRRATDVIEEVQRALLPARLPVLPGVEVAASYVVGGAEQAAGGDWFDVLARPDGTVAAVVGDVVGHGVAASAVMAQLRAVALERLDAGADPAQVVTALDRFTRVVPAARSATVCVLVLGPDAGSGRRAVAYCAAGHPPRWSSTSRAAAVTWIPAVLRRWATPARAPARPGVAPVSGAASARGPGAASSTPGWVRVSWCCCTPTGSSSGPGWRRRSGRWSWPRWRRRPRPTG